MFLLAQVVSFQARTDTPVARDGVLDLSDFDFTQSGSLALTGDWKFVDGQFLTQGDLTAGIYEALARTVSVPGKRTDYPRQGNEPTAFGCGTYYLRVLLGDHTMED